MFPTPSATASDRVRPSAGSRRPEASPPGLRVLPGDANAGIPTRSASLSHALDIFDHHHHHYESKEAAMSDICESDAPDPGGFRHFANLFQIEADAAISALAGIQSLRDHYLNVLDIMPECERPTFRVLIAQLTLAEFCWKHASHKTSVLAARYLELSEREFI